MTERSQQIAVIVGLRGLAAMMVVLFHFVVKTVDFIHDPLAIGIFGEGDLGVQIFFVISGIVIPFSLIKASFDYSKMGTFLLKRCARIEPPYLVAMLLAFVYIHARQWLPGAVPSDYSPGWFDIALHVGYLVPFVEGARWFSEVFWTLAIEFQYYLLIALAMPMLLSKREWMRWAFLIAFAASSYLPFGDRQLLYWSPLFLCGILFALQYFQIISTRTYWITAMVCVGFVWYKMGIENFLAASFALLVLWTIPHFQSKITNFFGQISYSLYLIHTITGGAVVNILSHRVTGVWGKFGVIVLGVAFATLCAYLFYRWIEKPAQKWSQRLQYQNKKGTLSQ